MAITDNLVAYYPMDSNLNDATGNHNATPESGLFEFDGAYGKVGKGLATSTGTAKNFASIANPINISTAWSFQAWINPYGDQNRPIGFAQGGNTGWIFGAQENGNTFALVYDRWTANKVYVYANGNYISNGGSSPTEDAWNHVVITYDGSTMKQYLNGTLVGSVAASGLPAYAVNKMFNYTIDNGNHFYGLIDELAVWERAITSEEVSALYGGGNGMVLLGGAGAGAGGGGGNAGSFRPLKWLTRVTASESAKFEEGLDANSQKITNVADGAATSDALAYGQLTGLSSSMKSYVDAADATIQTNIDNASGSIKAYTDAAQSAAQTSLNNMSSSMKTYVDGADATLQSNIDSVSSSLVSYVDAADQVLQTNIDNVSSSLKTYVDAADQAFQTSLDNVSGSMKSYVDARETALQSNLDAVSASLSSSLAAEKAARIAEDETLLKLDGTRAMTGDLNMGTYNITNAASASFAGDLTVQGVLQTNGTVTSLNTTNIDVTDKLVTIGKGSADAAAADGAGIEVDGAGVSLTYDSASNAWVSDIGLRVTNEASFDAAMKLSGSAFTNISVGITSSKYDVNDAIRALDLGIGNNSTNITNAYNAARYVVTGAFSIASIKASAYFNASGDYLSVASNAAFGFTTDDFTIEMWVYPDASQPGVPRILGNLNGSWAPNGWTITSNDYALYIYNASNSSPLLTPSVAPAANEWSHIAYVRNGSTWTVYVNGVSRGTTTWSGAVDSGTEKFAVASSGISSEGYKGYIDDLRVTKGTARYTTNFTPPQTELSLIGDTYAGNVSLLLNMNGVNNSTNFVDSSNNVFSVTQSGNAKLSTTQSKYGPADGEAETVVVDLTTNAGELFATAEIDNIAIDSMIDQGEGWTNYLVSAKLFVNGSELQVQIDAPAAESGNKYRLIAVNHKPDVLSYITGGGGGGAGGTGISNGLVAYYAFENNAIDSAGGNNGTANSVTYVSGKLGSAINTGYVEVNSSELNLTSSMSFACWLKLDSGGAYRFLLHRGVNNAAGTYEFRINPSNYIEVFGQGALFDPLQTGQWHHFATTKDSNGLIKTYLNGTLLRTLQGSAGQEDLPSQRTLIGSRDDGFTTLGGALTLDEVALWNRVITDSEITQMYNSGAGLTYQNL